MPVTRHGKSLCYAVLPASVCQKLRGAASRSTVIICVVSQLVANYPRTLRQDNLNVGTCPDPFSSPCEFKGLVPRLVSTLYNVVRVIVHV